jgi:uncharacterized protein YodC (DUF2158 family)
MATKFTKGQEVKLVATVPQGPVQALRMSEDGVISYLIEWVDADGETKQRWFEEDQLTAV